MKIGIVGSEKSKFTDFTEKLARQVIRTILTQSQATHIVSGHCHLGGIDIYAVEEAKGLGFKDDQIIEFPPKELSWDAGYKPRNIQIAKESDEVYCITVDRMPPWKDPVYCYHCKTLTHVKSGGCWTAKYAKRLGKPAAIYVVHNEGFLSVEEIPS